MKQKTSHSSVLLDDEIYELQAQLCSALAHPIRLKILDLIADGEKTHTELLQALSIPKPNLSQHMNLLREAGLVKSRREGLYQYCSLGMPQIKNSCQMIRKLLKSRLENSRSQHQELARALAGI